MNQRYLSTENNPTKIKVNGIEIHYLKIGNGPQTLLMFPGTLGSTNDYKSLTDNLNREKYTMIVWDPPGYGLSRPPDRDFSPGHLHRDADHAISLMKALHVDRYSLLGWCNGGCTALIVASRAVDRVEKLVVWSCNAYVTEKDIAHYQTIQDIRQWPITRMQPLVELYGEKYASETWKAWVDSCRKAFEENDGNFCRETLPEIDAPTLILQGTLDSLIPVQHAVYLHENIKHSSLEIFPEGKHNLHSMMTERFNSVVDNFLTIRQ